MPDFNQASFLCLTYWLYSFASWAPDAWGWSLLRRFRLLCYIVFPSNLSHYYELNFILHMLLSLDWAFHGTIETSIVSLNGLTGNVLIIHW